VASQVIAHHLCGTCWSSARVQDQAWGTNNIYKAKHLVETVETCLHLEGLEASSAIYASKVKHSQTEVASVLGTEQASRAHEPWNEHMFSAQMYASVWNMSSKSASQGVFTQE